MREKYPLSRIRPGMKRYRDYYMVRDYGNGWQILCSESGPPILPLDFRVATVVEAQELIDALCDTPLIEMMRKHPPRPEQTSFVMLHGEVWRDH